jgi:hypothetical protein
MHIMVTALPATFCDFLAQKQLIKQFKNFRYYSNKYGDQ